MIITEGFHTCDIVIVYDNFELYTMSYSIKSEMLTING